MSTLDLIKAQKYLDFYTIVHAREWFRKRGPWRFEPGKMFRLTELVKNVRFDPNLGSCPCLGPNMNFFQV